MTASARPRDAEATRRALLDAARTLFAQDGYDATTVRAVADRAGVNQALLFRYFGNKEGLFVEAVRGRALDVLAAGPQAELLDRLLSAVLQPAEAPDVFMAVLRGTGSARVGAQLRGELEDTYTAALADLVDTSDRADAEVRAQLLLAWLLGITMVRSTPDTRAAPSATSLPHLRRAAHSLLHGT